MSKSPVSALSKKLSWLLRHGAAEAGVSIDAAGWVEIADVLTAVNTTREQLDDVVRENNKSRFEVDGTRIRASQGHSIATVTLDGLESSWTLVEGDQSIWHGTSSAAMESIAAQGILPGARTHVHLAETTTSPVGKRASVEVMIEVSPTLLRAAGQRIFRSPNGVILVRHVPPHCVIGVVGVTRRAAAEQERWRALFPSARAN